VRAKVFIIQNINKRINVILFCVIILDVPSCLDFRRITIKAKTKTDVWIRIRKMLDLIIPIKTDKATATMCMIMLRIFASTFRCLSVIENSTDRIAIVLKYPVNMKLRGGKNLGGK
jgi:hypothetical protein